MLQSSPASMRLGNLIVGYGETDWARDSISVKHRIWLWVQGGSNTGRYIGQQICFSVKASILASQGFNVFTRSYFFTGRVNGSRVHNCFSASIRTAGALLPSTDFIGITDIVNDILMGERTEPLYKEQKEKKSRSAELHQQALQWAISTTSSSFSLRRRYFSTGIRLR